MYKYLPVVFAALLLSCNSKQEKIKPTVESISESIYASGIVKSKNQYQVYPAVTGIIDQVLVTEGDAVTKGTPLFLISDETQRLNRENAELAANFTDFDANQGKLNDAKLLIEQARNKMKNDSLLFIRQSALWKEQIGTENELYQRELAYQNSKSSYNSTILKYQDLKRQLDFSSNQSKKNLTISSKIQNDYTIKSEMEGIVYSLQKVKGEMAGTQTSLAVIGDASSFILEMQVDEYDIIRIKKGLTVLISLESYKNKVFEATVSKINPLMNERSKTFLVEATFVKQPDKLYPNISFEGNIIIQTKEKALLIPRNYLLNDSTVIKANGQNQLIKTGLKDYYKIEVLSGITSADELLKPVL